MAITRWAVIHSSSFGDSDVVKSFDSKACADEFCRMVNKERTAQDKSNRVRYRVERQDFALCPVQASLNKEMR